MKTFKSESFNVKSERTKVAGELYMYVIQHQYKPPDEFIEAILAGEPDSIEQRALLKKYTG